MTRQGEMTQVAQREVQAGYNDKNSSLKEWLSTGIGCSGNVGFTIPGGVQRSRHSTLCYGFSGHGGVQSNAGRSLEVFSNLYDSMSL